MKKAKTGVVYLICGIVIGYLVASIISMAVYLIGRSFQVYTLAYWLQFSGAKLTCNAVLACVIAWFLLGNLETEIHRRDLTGYVLFPLAYTLQWACNYLYGGLYTALHSPRALPWYVIVILCAVIFGPFLAAEIGLFCFFRSRGKKNYPQAYKTKPRAPKTPRFRLSRKKILFVLVILILLIGFTMLFLNYGEQGCRVKSDYFLDGYQVSGDGTAVTVTIGSPTSFWPMSNELVLQRDGDRIYATAYYNVAIFDWLYEAREQFEIPLDPEVTEIWFFDYRTEGFALSLRRVEDGAWQISRWDPETETFIWCSE